MSFLFLLFLIDKENLQKHALDMNIKFPIHNGNMTNCGPLATLNVTSNKCVCLFHGDPYDDIGCYDCIPPCRHGSYCAPPPPTDDFKERSKPNRGSCKCIEGFYRSSPGFFADCVVAVPEITIYYPIKGPIGTVVNFTLRSLPGFTSKNIYCQFNDIIEDGVKITENFVQCKIPEFKPVKEDDNKLRIALSYDRMNWSKFNVAFEVTGLPTKFKFTPFYICGIVITIVGALFLVGYLHYGITSEASGADEPLLNRGEKY